MMAVDSIVGAMASWPWLPLLVEVAVKGTLLLLAAALLTALLRRSSASVRHQVWALAFAALLALPLLAAFLPSWQVPLLPGSMIVEAPTIQAPTGRAATPTPAEVDPPREAPHEATRLAARAGRADGSGVSTATGAGSPGDAIDGTVAGLSEPGARSSTGLGEGEPSSASWRGVVAWAGDLGWLGLGLAAWIIGAALLTARLAVGVVSACWTTRRARPVTDPRWRELAAEEAERIGLRRPVRLLLSPAVRTPMAWGFLRPAVLLPEGSLGWPAARRRVVLLHELAHIKRRDCHVQLLAHAAAALHWLNPLVWLASRRLQSERERACDDLVLAAGTSRTDYARHLLEIARSMSRSDAVAWAAVSMARPSQLEGRLLAILDPQRRRDGLPRLGSLLAMASMFCLIVPLAAVQPWVEAAEVEGGGLDRTPTQASEPAGQGDAADESSATPFRDLTSELAAAGAREMLPELLARYGDSSHGDVPYGGGRLGALVNGEFVAEVTVAADDPEAIAQETAEAVSGPQEPQGTAVSDRIFEAMIRALSDQDPEMRSQAAHSLGMMESDRAIESLSGALRNDDSPGVRRQAAWALGMIESPAAIPALADGLADSDAGVREQAAWALGMIEDASAIPALGSTLDDPEDDVREQVIWALGMIEDRGAVEPLTRALGDSSAAIREQAAWSLGMIEDPSAVGPLAGALSDAEPAVREQVAWALGMIEDPSAVGPLTAALSDAEVAVREQVVWALGMIEDSAAIDGLIQTLRGDSSAQVRVMAAWSLGMIRDEAAVEALIDALEDEDIEVRKKAMWALTMVMDTPPDGD